MKKIVLLIFIIVLPFNSCEKDDICEATTPTTPRLVITFYDINNTSVLKKVDNLKVVGEGMTEGIIFNPDAIGEAKYLTNESKIAIPLKVDSNSTKYSFTLHSGNTTNPSLVNLDILEFNYTKENFFVSRACGFKTLFELNSNNPFLHTDGNVPDQKWMKFISVKQSNITNENETHISIFF